MLTTSVASNTLCINIDGMDQSKFRVPRVGRISQPKMLQALFRPTLHVTGSWAHGHRLSLWVSDEDLRKDSTTQQEVLSRTLTDVYQRFGSLPMGCCLQQDNCYREGKNRHIVSHMVLLVALRCFRFCVCNFCEQDTVSSLRFTTWFYFVCCVCSLSFSVKWLMF